MSHRAEKSKGLTTRNILKYTQEGFRESEDFLAVEEPLQIEIDGKPLSITMRTPGDDAGLAVGFLYTEGLIKNFHDIAAIHQFEENTINVILENGVCFDPRSTERNFYTTSSCGVCGKTSIELLRLKSDHNLINTRFEVGTSTLLSLQDELIKVQENFGLTGGIHASALFKNNGSYVFHSEDVGRHNALDKLIGRSLMAGKIPLKDNILLLSGRASFELVQKAYMAGITCIAAVGAPSSLAVDLARENGQTLVGFLKNHRFNIYSGHEYVKG
jgi:FdhD protein